MFDHVVPSTLNNVYFRTVVSRLKKFIRVDIERHNSRLQIAFAFSLFLHATLFLVMAPTQRNSTGGGQESQTPQVIYAVLKAARPAAQNHPVDSPAEALLLAASSAAETSVKDLRQSKEGFSTKPDERTIPKPVARAVLDTLPGPLIPGLPTVPGYAYGVGLDRQPRLLNEINVEYPTAAGAREGKLVLRFQISESGALDGLAVVKSDPEGVFEEAALRAFSTAEFAPGVIFGLPVKSQFFVEVEFYPASRDNVSGRGY